MHWSIIMKFKSWFRSDSELIYVKKKIWENDHVNIQVPLPFTYNSTAHLSNVLKLSWSFETQWNLCWKYIINKFYFRTNTKSTNIRIHELVIFNQTTKIDTHEEKYFHSTIWSQPWQSLVLLDYHNWCMQVSTITLQ